MTTELIVGATIAALTSTGSAVANKYNADKQAGEMRKAQARAEQRQAELLKAKGPEASQSNETYDALSSKRMDMFKKGLASTIKTSNFGLLDTASNAGKTKLGQ